MANIPFPDKKYNVIYADPPWSYSDKGCNGAAENHYHSMKISDICSLPVKEIAADDCVLFLWATYPMLKEALKVIEAWGFTYKSLAFQWVKLNRSGIGYFFGLGRWTRGNTEPCLLAIKGKPIKKSSSVRQLIVAPVGRHALFESFFSPFCAAYSGPRRAAQQKTGRNPRPHYAANGRGPCPH